MPSADPRLRELIRELVIATLQRLQHEPSAAEARSAGEGTRPGATAGAGTDTPASAPQVRRALVLLTGSEPLSADFINMTAGLKTQGFEFSVALSRTFEQHHAAHSGAAEVLASRFPGGISGTPRLTSATPEPELLKAVRNAAVVIAPRLSSNTAAKVALGISDSLPSLVLQEALAAGLPIIMGESVPNSPGEGAGAAGTGGEIRSRNLPPALARTFADHQQRLQTLGIRFVPLSRVAAEVSSAFYVAVNDTPQRLAKTRPSPKRTFVTAEDVWEVTSRGLHELIHPASAIVTDAAREEAVKRGVTLRADPTA